MTGTEHATDDAGILPAMGSYGYADLGRLMSLMTGDEKHGPAATSTLDALWVLYDRVLNVDPCDPGAGDRDRFLLSKGHGPAAFYAVLAAKGFIDATLLPGFGGFGSPLGYHPDRVLLPGVEISSGSLGHGLPLAAGTALGLRARGLARPRVFTLVGDNRLRRGGQAGEPACHCDLQRLIHLWLARGHSGQVRAGALVGADRGRP